MKLSQAGELRALFQENHQEPPTGQALYDFLMQRGIFTENLYQELEMDSRFVDTHEDVSHTGEVVQLHSHIFYELLYCRSGSLQYLLGSERYRIQPGDILFIPPGVSHRPLFLEQLAEPYARYVVWLSSEFVEQLQQNFPGLLVAEHQARLLRPAGAAQPFLEEVFRRGSQEAARREPGWQAAVTGNTLQLLVHIDRALAAGQRYTPPAERPELLDAVLGYIEAHLAEKITLESTARHFLVSESTISQLFHHKLGVGFYRCVTQRRLISAKALILRGEPMEAVSEAVGFADYSTFYRAFKREYGISPTQYRRMQQAER